MITPIGNFSNRSSVQESEDWGTPVASEKNNLNRPPTPEKRPSFNEPGFHSHSSADSEEKIPGMEEALDELPKEIWEMILDYSHLDSNDCNKYSVLVGTDLVASSLESRVQKVALILNKYKKNIAERDRAMSEITHNKYRLIQKNKADDHPWRISLDFYSKANNQSLYQRSIPVLLKAFRDTSLGMKKLRHAEALITMSITESVKGDREYEDIVAQMIEYPMNATVGELVVTTLKASQNAVLCLLILPSKDECLFERKEFPVANLQDYKEGDFFNLGFKYPNESSESEDFDLSLLYHEISKPLDEMALKGARYKSVLKIAQKKWAKLIPSMKDAIPSGNFEDVIKDIGKYCLKQKLKEKIQKTRQRNNRS